MHVRCLLVDDNHEFIASAARLLESQGVDIVGSATSSAEAVRLIDELEPDVVLVDIELGGEDGIELAWRIHGQRPSSKVILISSYALDDVEELVARGPISGFISKSELSAEAVARIA